MKKYCYWLLVVVTMGIASCSSTKNIPQGDALYTGATVTVKDDSLRAKKKREVRKQLESFTRPKPNTKLLGMRFKLWVWNIAGNPKSEKGIRGWLKYKVGEPPVLLSSVKLNHNVDVLKSYLENKGFFHAKLEADTTVKRKKATAQYTAITGPQYTVAELYYPADTNTDLTRRIYETLPGTLIKKDAAFDLDIIKTERLRIDDHLKEHGFYFFNPDYIIVNADSTIGNNKVNLYLKLKPSLTDEARKVYRIKDVFIYSAFNLRETTTADTSKRNAEYYDGYYVVDRRKFYKPKLFRQSMPFDPGDIYNRTDHNTAINRLINLDIFKFVKNRFEVVDQDSALMNVYYYLTRLPKKSLRIELNGNTKSNNLTGSNITVSWKNRNLFRGGEILGINTNVGFEVQYSGQFSGVNNLRYGAELNLSFPRFLVPFFNFNTKGGYLPRTRVSIGYDVLRRTELYSMNSLSFNWGYNWKENGQKEHELIPFTITYVNPIEVTQAYIDSAHGNVTLLRAVEKQFILGSSYSFIYSNLVGQLAQNGLYFHGVLDLSGNVAGLITGANVKKGDTVKIWNSPFSQYTKIDLDFRLYRKVGIKSVWVNRLITGIGIPYGNSSELPYIKQFFSGGNNSIRAFRSRSLGPGIFVDTASTSFYDQSGDIRLEFNSEFRFPISGVINGAVFLDAGNIWLWNDNPGKPGGQFTGQFLKQLAVGAGAGLRFDFNFLVLRLDLATPIRKPWELNPWVINNPEFAKTGWRKQDLVFNLAIGYPF